MVRDYAVQDMTCQSCVRTVTQAVQRLPGVARVEVSLATGTVSIEAAPEVTSEAIVAAISAAGYENVAPLAEDGGHQQAGTRVSLI
jgi:copper chaperone CopZ